MHGEQVTGGKNQVKIYLRGQGTEDVYLIPRKIFECFGVLQSEREHGGETIFEGVIGDRFVEITIASAFEYQIGILLRDQTTKRTMAGVILNYCDTLKWDFVQKMLTVLGSRMMGAPHGEVNLHLDDGGHLYLTATIR